MQRNILRGSIIVQYIMEFYKYIFEVENNTMIYGKPKNNISMQGNKNYVVYFKNNSKHYFK